VVVLRGVSRLVVLRPPLLVLIVVVLVQALLVLVLTVTVAVAVTVMVSHKATGLHAWR
jgi:hypothetical protein